MEAVFFPVCYTGCNICSFMNEAEFNKMNNLFPEKYVKIKEGDIIRYNLQDFKVHRVFNSGKIDARRLSDGACVFLLPEHYSLKLN